MTALIVTPLRDLLTVKPGCDIAGLALAALTPNGLEIQNDDILVIAQKIVSKAEGRLVRLADVTPSAAAQDYARRAEKDPRLVELILRESTAVLRCRPGVIIVAHRLGYVMANAGIDASNVETGGGEAVLLLPADPDASAASIRQRVMALSGVDVGVIINDSFGRAWRLGTTGTAIGAAGLPALVNLRGRVDRNGRVLQVSEVAAADELAAAASLMMGQADEGQPIIHIRGFPYPRREGNAAELLRPAALDLFR